MLVSSMNDVNDHLGSKPNMHSSGARLSCLPTLLVSEVGLMTIISTSRSQIFGLDWVFTQMISFCVSKVWNSLTQVLNISHKQC